MRNWQKNMTLFGIGAAGYSLIEIAARGYTHWTMTLTGGVCAVALYHAHRKLKKSSIFARCSVGALIITAAEWTVGMIVNRALRWNVWDYSDRMMNVLGQICPRFTMYWFMLNVPLIPLFGLLEKRLFSGAERQKKKALIDIN